MPRDERLTRFESVAESPTRLKHFDEEELISTRDEDRSARNLVDDVIRVLDDRRVFCGRAVKHGSQTRQTNLAGISDVDVLCFIEEDRNANRLRSIEDFERVRGDASMRIRNYLLDRLPEYVDVELDDFWPGFCLKLRVKKHRSSRREWSVDVIFAYKAPGNSDIRDIYEELRSMSRADKMENTNTFSVARSEFVDEILDTDDDIRVLVRLLKHFKQISKEAADCGKAVSSFAVEMLVVLLYAKGIIPRGFQLDRALCTCLEYIGYPNSRALDQVIIRSRDLRGTPWSHFEIIDPSSSDLDEIKRCGHRDDLVIVDPFAPFSNIAASKSSTSHAWRELSQDAQDLYHHLMYRGVHPYRQD